LLKQPAACTFYCRNQKAAAGNRKQKQPGEWPTSSIQNTIMIPAFELRIGDYVLVGENIEEISTVSRSNASTVRCTTDGEQIITQHSLEQIEPVLLTDDILKQCGFVFHHYFKFWQLISTGIRSEMNISADYEVIDFMRKPILKKLVSLHQLQNIYSMLKGRELQVLSLPIGP
jgi:hypothetical protein